jgi:myo-inositol-1(or 4)-monophosphatase
VTEALRAQRPSESWYPDALNKVIGLCETVGAEVLSQAEQLRSQQRDKDASGIDLVTAADNLAEQRLLAGLASFFPDHRIEGEEGGVAGPEDSPWRWWVDPLDGTCNFSRGLPFWAHSVGLAYDGVPVLGVVHGPACGITVSAAAGYGARDGKGQPLAPASPPGDPSSWVIATDWPWDLDQRRRTEQLIHGLAPLVRQYKTMGSAAIDKALLALGRIDAYAIHGTFPWDQCGGVAVLLELYYEVHRWEAGEWRIGCGDIALMRPGMWSVLGPLLAPT